MKAQGQKLDGDNLQDVLNAGDNASRVGRQQFFTQFPIAQALMTPLPSAVRSEGSTFVDFTMGDGALLAASGAQELFGADIDSRFARKPQTPKPVSRPQFEQRWHTVCADLTRFYPLLQEVDWRFDICGLNPPFSVKWHRKNLAALIDSECPEVRETFAPLRKQFIDSTLATLLIALDRMTERGEGFLLCTEAVARKIAALPVGGNIWLWLRMPGAGTAIFGKNVRPFDVAALYFARSHWNYDEDNTLVATAHCGDTVSSATDAIRAALIPAATQRALYRRGQSIFYGSQFADVTGYTWRAAAEEWRRQQKAAAGEQRKDYNIWLRENGTIGRHLTPFQTWSARISNDQAEALHKLEGQTPMSLVVQRATRSKLLAAIDESGPWRVDPALTAAVAKAVGEYHSQRAPFYALSEIQRLGYLDEEDTIVCKRDGLDGFEKGQRYDLASETIDIERPEARLSLLGEREEITLHGKELAFYIADKTGRRHKFSPVAPEHEAKTTKPPTDAIFHDLEILVRHFEIPAVPDVAQIYPERYQQFVSEIRAIENEINDRQGTAAPVALATAA